MANKLLPKTGGWVLINKHIPTEVPVHAMSLYYAFPTGNYTYEGESGLANFFQDRDRHPTTGEHMYKLIEEFGRNGVKIALANYKRNPHHDFTDRQRELLESYDSRGGVEELFPIEAQIKIVTDWGQVCVNPYEYSIPTEQALEEYFESIKEGHAFIKYLSKSGQLKLKVKEQIFYLRSRGISYSDALVMCVGQVKTSNLFYLYMHPAYVEYFTRDFDQYVRSHLHKMLITENVDDALEYLSKVRQIEGYSDFQFGGEILQTKLQKIE